MCTPGRWGGPWVLSRFSWLTLTCSRSICPFLGRRGGDQVQGEPPSSTRGITATALLLLRGEVGRDTATPNLGRGCEGNAGITWPLAGQLCARFRSYSTEMGRTGLLGNWLPVSLSRTFLICRVDIIMEGTSQDLVTLHELITNKQLLDKATKLRK